MSLLSKYGFKFNPFVTTPFIKIQSIDSRLNGQLFYSAFCEKEASELLEMILSKDHFLIFIRGYGLLYGNGKSAFLAHAYWELKDNKYDVIWADVTENPHMKILLSNIVEAFIMSGAVEELKNSIGDISFEILSDEMERCDVKYSKNTIKSLEKILSQSEEDITHFFATIKQRRPTEEYTNLLGALIDLISTSLDRSYVIFIDQFEEYVKAHRTTNDRKKLNGEINDLFRALSGKVTIVVSLHSEAESILNSGDVDMETFVNIDKSSIDIPKMTENDLYGMVELYIRNARIDNYKNDKIYPFEENVIRYVINKSEFNPRNVIVALRSAITYGSMLKVSKLDSSFLMFNHKKIFGGLPNDYNAFIHKKWKYKYE